MIKDGKEIIYKKSVSGCIKEYGAGIGEKVAAVFLDERKEFFTLSEDEKMLIMQTTSYNN